ncbi:hypothetical protein [Brevundimonas sp. GCM10030266]|uniref:hypothetical protein n=1 Tax=Brevundimonas sp. GCM10030266 TaxID=3273386 RepID=UPI00360AF9A8
MTAAPDIRTAALKADVILTETVRIEGSLRAIRDVGGMTAVEAALNTAKRRVILASNDNEDWVA